ncbi:unnamed protein product [Rhizophagus irregularis]|nr:unnamed protein product [Rhizophagus irregularis]
MSEDEFNEKWQILCSAYANKPRIIEYFEDTWVLWKKKFVKAWVQTAITLMVTNQKKEINSMVASDRIHLPIFAHNNPLYANIKGKISIFALKKINEQYQKSHATAKEPLPPCTGFFSTTMGLPCAYNIQQLDNNQGLILDNIHKHWWIQEHFSVPQCDESAFSHENALRSHLQNLQKRYQEWHATLDEMINAPLVVLQNPNIVPTKGCPSGATNK